MAVFLTTGDVYPSTNQKVSGTGWFCMTATGVSGPYRLWRDIPVDLLESHTKSGDDTQDTEMERLLKAEIKTLKVLLSKRQQDGENLRSQIKKIKAKGAKGKPAQVIPEYLMKKEIPEWSFLTFIRHKDGSPHLAECRCACGKVVEVSYRGLKLGSLFRCSTTCHIRPSPKAWYVNGMPLPRLKHGSVALAVNKDTEALEIQCDCGSKYAAAAHQVLRGSHHKCPACQSYRYPANGMTRPITMQERLVRFRLRRAWHSLRGFYKKNPVQVKESWYFSFTTFAKEVPEYPADEEGVHYYLIRVDLSKGYFDGNLKWATVTDSRSEAATFAASLRKGKA